VVKVSKDKNLTLLIVAIKPLIFLAIAADYHQAAPRLGFSRSHKSIFIFCHSIQTPAMGMPYREWRRDSPPRRRGGKLRDPICTRNRPLSSCGWVVSDLIANYPPKNRQY